MVSEGSLPLLQEPATRPPILSPVNSVHTPSHFLTVHFNLILPIYVGVFHDKWVPVTTAWRVLWLLMEGRPPIWRVAANISNKRSRTADKG